MKVHELFERDRGVQYLYHGCYAYNLLTMLILNKMLHGGGINDKAAHYYKQKEIKSTISFSRDPHLFKFINQIVAGGDWPVIIVFNQEKLKYHYKISPVNNHNIYDLTADDSPYSAKDYNPKGNKYQAEEFLIDKDIQNVTRYIEEINIFNKESFNEELQNFITPFFPTKKEKDWPKPIEDFEKYKEATLAYAIKDYKKIYGDEWEKYLIDYLGPKQNWDNVFKEMYQSDLRNYKQWQNEQKDKLSHEEFLQLHKETYPYIVDIVEHFLKNVSKEKTNTKIVKEWILYVHEWIKSKVKVVESKSIEHFARNEHIKPKLKK